MLNIIFLIFFTPTSGKTGFSAKEVLIRRSKSVCLELNGVYPNLNTHILKSNIDTQSLSVLPVYLACWNPVELYLYSVACQSVVMCLTGTWSAFCDISHMGLCSTNLNVCIICILKVNVFIVFYEEPWF